MENENQWKLPKLTKTQTIAALLILCLVAGLGSYALASYVMTSNTISGTPSAQATLTITSSTTTPVSGVAWTITAHVSDNTAGLTISLSNNGGTPVTAVTDSSGNAVFTVAPTAAFSYVATATHA